MQPIILIIELFHSFDDWRLNDKEKSIVISFA